MKRPALLEQPRTQDALLAIALAALVEWEILTSDVSGPTVVLLLLGLVVTLPLALRRRAPIVAVAIVIAGVVAFGVLDLAQEPQTPLLAVLLGTYSAGAHASRPSALIGAAIVLGGVLAQEPGDFVVLGPLVSATWLVGRLVRANSLQATRLAELTAVLEREQADNARLAIAHERVRIARELHDVVAHSVSVIVLQAGAERLTLGEERPSTRDVLLGIERTGREALVEMRRLVGVLRRSEEKPELAPQPSLARLEDLVEHVRRAGLPIDLIVEGAPVELAPGLDVSAFRIVQEALTNALKHAGQARTTLVVRYGQRLLEIEVADEGTGAAPENDDGHGLVGMRERIALYGGELDAGRREGGGYVVRARFPLDTAAT